ncbi:MAG: S1C family serine protease [Candidatus Scatovivens sp.]
MYYENRKQKNFTIFFIFIIIILIFIAGILFKISISDSQVKDINYEVTKTSTQVGENVEEKKVDIKELIEASTKCVVGISKLEQNGTSIFSKDGVNLLGLGSGVVVSENGYIITNEHVSGAKFSNCYVTLENGKSYTGNVVWSNSDLDLSIVKIEGYYLDYLELGDSDNIFLGQDVYAIGNPIGHEFQRTVTKGIVSGINRTLKIEESNSYMEDLIQTDATINEGNSGGPIIGENGKVIGITTIKISSAEGIGFAVPVNIIKPILEKLINTGKFEESYLGIYGYDKEVIKYLEEKLEIETGIYIAKIMPDSPLLVAGVAEKDIIVKIDDTNINKMNDLKKYIYTKNPGDKVTLTISRDGIEKTVEVTLSTKIS